MVPSKSAGAAAAAAADACTRASTASPSTGAAAFAALSPPPLQPASRPMAISVGSNAVLRKVENGVCCMGYLICDPWRPGQDTSPSRLHGSAFGQVVRPTAVPPARPVSTAAGWVLDLRA